MNGILRGWAGVHIKGNGSTLVLTHLEHSTTGSQYSLGMALPPVELGRGMEVVGRKRVRDSTMTWNITGGGVLDSSKKLP